jgi:hypothetical protein
MSRFVMQLFVVQLTEFDAAALFDKGPSMFALVQHMADLIDGLMVPPAANRSTSGVARLRWKCWF